MKIGLMNNPRASLYKQMKAMGKAGYDFVDLTIEGPTLAVDVERVHTICREHGLDIVGHTDPCLPWAYPMESVRDACFKELERCAHVFSQLGAKTMNIHPCYACPPGMKQGLLEHNMAALKPLVEMAGHLELDLVMENFRPPFDTVSTFQALIEEVPGLNVHLDVGHTHMGRDSAEAFCRHFGKRITHVHLSDNRGTGDHHMPIGAGNIDWPASVRALQEIGYDSTITLEVFCGSDAVRFDYLEVSRRYLQDLWAQRNNRS